jgi:hypothetical protein
LFNASSSIYSPVSIAEAFYPFDKNVLDLYCRRDGLIVGPPVAYTFGYVLPGMALSLNSSMGSSIFVNASFNMSSFSFTIEGFIQLDQYSTNVTLLQFSSGITVSIHNGILVFVLTRFITLQTYLRLTLHRWYHFAVVYNNQSMLAEIFIDGLIQDKRDYLSSQMSTNINSSLTIGVGFDGVIDQLSIAYEAKSRAQILWDATTLVYFPMNGDRYGWLMDYGPNVVNGSSSRTQSTVGIFHEALSFRLYGAFYSTSGLTPLNVVDQPLTIVFWLRLAEKGGTILTISNSFRCLLVIGVRTSDQRLLTFLPNATSNNESITLIGSVVPNEQWIQIAFTWSVDHAAQVYQNFSLDARNTEARKLNQGMGDHMQINIGLYRGKANCNGAQGFDTSEQFLGDIDEFYAFARELESNEIQQLNI